MDRITNMTTNRATSDETNVAKANVHIFMSLWADLRTNYEGTNVTKTVARLLNMYQPHDGILIYERLLRTLCFLLEDFDKQNLRLLVSMVPPPKGISEKCLNEAFHKATGFVRFDTPLLLQNESHITSSDALNLNKFDADKNGDNDLQGIVINKFADSSEERNSPKVLPVPGEVLRGFAPNEIVVTQNHVEDVNNFCGSAHCRFATSKAFFAMDQDFQSVSDYRTNFILPAHFSLNCLQNPTTVNMNHTCQMSATRQDLVYKTATNKFIKLPVSKSSISYHSNLSNKNMQNRFNGRKFADVRILGHAPVLFKKNIKDVNELERYTKINGTVSDKRILRNAEFQLLKKELEIEQRALMSEIRKMDVVDWNEENHNAPSDIQMLRINSSSSPNVDFVASKTLRNSICNFLKRAREGVLLDVPAFPRTKPVFPQFQSTVSERSKLSINFEDFLVWKNRGDGIKKAVQKRKIDSTQGQKYQNIPQQNLTVTDNLQSFLKVENTSNDWLGRSSVVMNRDSIGNVLPRVNVSTDLLSYKRQYCDALLNNHHGEVTVESSLSSLRSPAGCDTCHLNYFHEHRELQQQQQQQQQQQFIINSEFALHEIQPRLRGTHKTAPYTWVRFNWEKSSSDQIKFHQQRKLLFWGSRVSLGDLNFGIPDTKFANIEDILLLLSNRILSQDARGMHVRCFMQTAEEARPYLKRKKLEEIVVKLREGEGGALKQ